MLSAPHKLQKWDWLLFSLILVVAALVRLYALDRVPPSLHPDEAVNGNNALEAWRTGRFHVFYADDFGREGLFINLQALTLGLIRQNQPWVLRLPSAMFGVLTVLGLYLLARKLLGNKAALLAAFCLATSFWHINVSRLGTRPVAAPLFLVWALYLLLVSCEAAERRNSASWFLAVVAGLVYGLGFHTYIVYAATPVLLSVFLKYLQRKHGTRCVLKIGVIAGTTALIAVAPLLIFACRQPTVFFQRTNQLAGLHSGAHTLDLLKGVVRTAAMFTFGGDVNPRHNIPGRPMLFWPVGLMFLIGLVVAVRKHHLLLWWVAITALPAVLANEGIPHALRTILMAPAVFMLAAIGGVALYDWSNKVLPVGALRILCCTLIGTLVLEACHTYFITWAHNPKVGESFDQSLVEAARRLDSLPRELPKYVVVEPDGMWVRGMPMGAQALMFLTDTFSPDRQREKNLHYLLPEQTNQIARGYVYVQLVGVVHNQ